MPTFLSDPPLVPLVGLAITGLIVAVLGVVFARVLREEKKWRTAGRVMAGAGGGLFLLMLAWFVIGLCLESPREESVRRVHEMAAALTERNRVKFSENVSQSFEKKLSGDRNQPAMNKGDLMRLFDAAEPYVAQAVAWNFDLTDPAHVTDTEVRIRFDAKATLRTGEPILRHLEATFVKDPDGKFRLKTYKEFDYAQKTQPAGFP